MRYVLWLALAVLGGCACQHERWYSQGNGTTVIIGQQRMMLHRRARLHCLDCGRYVGAWDDEREIGQPGQSLEEWRDR